MESVEEEATSAMQPIVEVVGRLERPARALIGWMSTQQAELAMSGNRMNETLSPEYTARAQQARDAVASRAVGLNQDNLVANAPDTLHEHIAALQNTNIGATFFQEGWNVALVDLRKVCVVQPTVFTDHAQERAQGVDPDDIVSIAAVSLPLPIAANLPAQFDQVKQAWLFTSPNPNMKIAGHFANPVQPGFVAFGFIVAILSSLMKVARFQGRYFLTDGYHRAYGFLKRNIPIVPVLVKELEGIEGLGLPAGLLPEGAYLGDRPPVLPDFLDDTVSTDVALPASQRLIVIQALESTLLG
jgi:hypothetical protein